MSETLTRNQPSNMQLTLNQLLEWSTMNLMNINSMKTKEMLLGSLNSSPPPTLYIVDHPVERVTSFKLLGVTVTDSLGWDENVSLICSKAAKRLHFLKILKRSGLAIDDLLHYYKSVVRPVLEYGSTVWHASITEEQTNRLDSIQRRAERIISVTQCSGKLTPLKERRMQIARRFFYSLQQPTNCLHDILPDRRDPEITSRLRHANIFETPIARTERYRRSFLVHALANYQQ